MDKKTVELIERKFKKDIEEIESKMRRNKLSMSVLADEQRKLKDTRKGLYDTLRLIKNS